MMESSDRVPGIPHLITPRSTSSRLGGQSLFTMCRFGLFDLLKDWWHDAVMFSVNSKHQTLLEVVSGDRPESITTGRRLIELGALTTKSRAVKIMDLLSHKRQQ